MRKLLGTVVVLSVMLAPVSHAQTSIAGAGADSGSVSTSSASSGNEVGASSSQSQSSSGSLSSATGGTASNSTSDTTTVNITTPTTPANGLGSASDPATSVTDNNVHYSGSETINNVPDQATIIESPTAPCMVPIGATISVAGFGGGAVGAYTSKTCEALERIRMTWNMNQQDVADQMMCQFDDYRNARAIIGKPCLNPDPPAMPASASSGPGIAQSQQAQAQVEDKPAVIMASTTPPVAPTPSPLAQFCDSLNPNNPDDAPYLATECNKN